MITIGSTASDVVTSAAAIIGDPALPEVLSLVKQLHALESAKASTPKPGTTTTKPTDFRAGVGLSAAVTPLKIILYARRNPWVAPTAMAGLVVVPLLLGFFLGRASRRSA